MLARDCDRFQRVLQFLAGYEPCLGCFYIAALPSMPNEAVESILRALNGLPLLLALPIHIKA